MNKIILSFFILTLSFSSIWSSPSYSKIILTREGARNLKKMVLEEVDWYSDLLKVSGHNLKIGGKTTIEAKDDYYQIKFQKVSLSLSQKQTIYIGDIILNAAPGYKGTWFLKLALPKRMAIYNLNKDVISNLSIEKQNFSATWIPIKGLYTKVNAFYKNIELIGTRQNPIYASIKSIEISSKLKGHYDETWKGNNNFTLKDLKIEATGSKTINFKLKKAKLSYIYDRLNAKRVLANRKTIETILPYIGQGKIQDDNSFIVNIAAKIQDLANNVTSSSEIAGLDLSIKDSYNHKNPFTLSLDKLTSETYLEDSQKEQARVKIINKFNGFHISNIPPELVGLIPYKGNINLKVQNIPFRKIAGIVLDGLKVTLNNAQFKINDILSYIPEVIKKAGTSFVIEDTDLKAVEAELAINSKFAAVNKAIYGVVGRIDVNIKGLETVKKRMQEIALNPKSSTTTSLYAGGFSTMSMIENIRNGVSIEPEDGVHYSLEITDDGNVILNNINLKNFIALGSVFENKILKEDKKAYNFNKN